MIKVTHCGLILKFVITYWKSLKNVYFNQQNWDVVSTILGILAILKLQHGQ